MTPDDYRREEAEELIAETRAEQRDLGDPMSPAEWDAWETGPGWHYAPGYEPKEWA
jgi:hypothetical protein